MKKTIALLAAVLSTVSFADTCFKADTKIPAYVKAPEVICVKDHGLKFSNRVQDIYYSFVDTSLGYDQNTVRFVLDTKKEEFQHDIFLQQESLGNCSSSKETIARFNFQVDELARNVEGTLKVKVEYNYSWDTCHMEPQTDTFSYSQI